MDNRQGIKLVVEHLVSQNISRIGFVGGSFYHPSIKERFEGFQVAMEKLGYGNISRNKKYHFIVDEETTASIGSQGAEKLVKTVKDIQAIICVNDTTASGCIQKLHSLNKKVPDDILVTGFDDVNYAALTNPSLSSVHVPKIEMGMGAMKMLMDRIENPERINQTQIVPVRLIKRTSSIIPSSE
jgi:LacI family transcriptional regulator